MSTSTHTVPTLAYVDCETTGLDPRIHQPYEVCWWREDEPEPHTLFLPHTLEYADQQALRVGGCFERFMRPFASEKPVRLMDVLAGTTLVGSNPAFDAAMLTRVIGTQVWHHRMIDVGTVAMIVLDLDRPIGLADVRTRLVDLGHDVPAPDHTAEGDVRTTRAAYEALRSMGGAR